MIDYDDTYKDERLLYHPTGKKQKKTKKSNHKHEYTDCVVEYDSYSTLVPHSIQRIWSYCKICGKINMVPVEHVWMKEIYRKSGIALYYTDEAKREFDPETRTLPYFHLDDMWQKYVDMGKDS